MFSFCGGHARGISVPWDEQEEGRKRTEEEDEERELKRCSCCSCDWISCGVYLGRRLFGVDILSLDGSAELSCARMSIATFKLLLWS